ncbi:MAG: hypothetical protein ABFS46_03475 [Myxococcota bacterium]
MSGELRRSLERTLKSEILLERFQRVDEDSLEQLESSGVHLGPEVGRGLAAVLASSPRAAGFLSTRSRLIGRLAELDRDWLRRRADELEAPGDPTTDLEGFLDELRLLRREDTLLAACLDLSGAIPFHEVSAFLSRLADTIVRRAFGAAASRASGGDPPELGVVAMGKLAGSEFTYHSDLDLIFLTPSGSDGIEAASRLAQRLVGYLSTMTGAGFAYRVDARLRPSGHQGMLVTTYEGFRHYQCERAERWEHLALLRSRAIAGSVSDTQTILDRTRGEILARAASSWDYVADLRRRVHAERGQESPSRLAFKAGSGGIMDVEFLATGAMLERGPSLSRVIDPSVPGMLRACVEGPQVEALLERYALLRRLEARVRWVSDRAVEDLDPGSDAFELAAALLDPDATPSRVLERIAEARHGIAASAECVARIGSILALRG